MAANRISADLSQEQRDAVMAAITTIQQNLPFLIDLGADERQGMVKFGDRNRSFVIKSLEVANQNPDILPGNFDLAEMQKDVGLVESLYPIHQALTTLFDKINDTYFAAGSEAYSAALHVYTYAKAANMVTGSLESVLDDLGKRFARKARSSGE